MQDAPTLEPTFRVMRSEDIDDVLEVLLAAFGPEWPKIPIRVPPLDHLKWKINTPQADPDDSTVIEIDGRIVGYSGSGGRDAWLRGERRGGWTGGDQCVHPEFQGLGLTNAQREWWRVAGAGKWQRLSIREGSNNPRLRLPSDRRGGRLRIANKVDVLRLPMKPVAMASAGRYDSRVLSLRPVLRAARLYSKMLESRLRKRRFSTPTAPLTTTSVDSFDTRADELWARAAHQLDFAVLRDSTYLNWRYCDPRAGDYRVRAAEDNGELVGWIVTATRLKDAEIVDLLAVPDNDNVTRALVDDAIATARRDGARSLSVLMPQVHPYRETFLRYGFIASRLPKPMGFDRRRDDLLDFLGWDAGARIHFAFGDTDHV